MADLSELTVGNLLTKNALSFPDKEALIFEGQRFTYRQINQKVNRLANALIDLGVGKGDKVALLFQNCNQFVESYFAVLKAGGVAVCLNWRLTVRELHGLIDFSDSKVVMYSDIFSQTADSIIDQLPQVRTVIIDGRKQRSEDLGFEALMVDYPDDEPQIHVKSTDGCEMLFTGGTTGLPKGVWRTHEAVVWSGMFYIKERFSLRNRSVTVPGLYTYCILAGGVAAMVESTGRFADARTRTIMGASQKTGHPERRMAKKPDEEPAPYSWDEQTSQLIDWFGSADLPVSPFRLRSGAEVTDPQRFYASLRNDIEQGVKGARARTGALQEDLAGLFDLFHET